jgi:hypothetical protein
LFPQAENEILDHSLSYSSGRGRRIGELAIQRLAILDATPKKRRHRYIGRDRLGQQTPELRVVPAQIVAAAIAVLTNAGAQPLGFDDQFFTGHLQEVFVRAG